MSLLIWIVLGAIAGWIANYLMKAGFDILVCILIGIIGGLLGGWLSSQLGGPSVSGNNIISLVVATLGACILNFLMRIIRQGRV